MGAVCPRSRQLKAIAPDGRVTVAAGTGQRGWVDGPVPRAAFAAPAGLCRTADGSVAARRRHRRTPRSRLGVPGV